MGDRKIESCTRTGFGRQTDRPAKGFDYFFCDRQTQPGAGIGFTAVQSFEKHENLFFKFRLNTNPVVAHTEFPKAWYCLSTDFDHWDLARRLIFDRVANQVQKYLADRTRRNL